jgi:uncharacterized surface protein with fasciclin (FAS1) repeats
MEETMKKFALAFATVLLTTFASMSVMAAPGERSDKNIVEIAVGAGSFNTLVAAVKAADLVGALSGPGPMTVFAPTDAAFAKLPAGTVEFLLANIDQLTSILTYHVVAGEKNPKELLSEQFVKTLEGSDVEAKGCARMLMINNSLVIAKPIYASNGVIYVIDTVLLP